MVARPRVKRREEEAHSARLEEFEGFLPNASITYELFSKLRLRQAEAAETAKPKVSSLITKNSESQGFPFGAKFFKEDP